MTLQRRTRYVQRTMKRPALCACGVQRGPNARGCLAAPHGAAHRTTELSNTTSTLRQQIHARLHPSCAATDCSRPVPLATRLVALADLYTQRRPRVRREHARGSLRSAFFATRASTSSISPSIAILPLATQQPLRACATALSAANSPSAVRKRAHESMLQCTANLSALRGRLCGRVALRGVVLPAAHADAGTERHATHSSAPCGGRARNTPVNNSDMESRLTL